MTALKTIAVLVSASCLSVWAANVPQTSEDKYYFTIPDHPGGIKGIVMGDPPDYRTMRSEDVTWLKEAYAERNALRQGAFINIAASNIVAEFGNWPQSSTNGLVGWRTVLATENGETKTNIVAKYSYSQQEIPNKLMQIGGPPWGSLVPWSSHGGGIQYRSGGNVVLSEGTPGIFLNPDPGVWSSQSIAPSNDFPFVNEIVTTTTTNWSGIYYESGEAHESVKTNVSYIVKTMLNGHESIHTNIWVEILPHIETKTVTNHLQKSMLGMMFNSGLVEVYDPPDQQVKDGPFRTEAITQNYEPLRNATVFAARGRNLTTNEITRTDRVWSESTPPSASDDDNTTSSKYLSTGWPVKNMSAETRTSKTFIIEGGIDPDTGEWHETGTKIETTSKDSGYITDDTVGSSGISLRMMVWLPYDTVYAGGVDGRIDYIEVWVWSYGSWSRQWELYANGQTQGDGENKTATFAKKIGFASVDGYANYGQGNTTNRYVCFSVNVPVASLLDDSMSATGKPFPSGKPSVSLEHACPDPNRDHPASSSWATESYSANITDIIFIVHIQPWTSLPSW